MRFRDYFTNDFETSDNHHIDTLRTRYYRARYDEAKNAILHVAKQMNATVKSSDDNFKEISIESMKFNAIFSVINVKMSECAIDIKVNTFAIIGLAKGKKIIEEIYQLLDKSLPFKGVSLYR